MNIAGFLEKLDDKVNPIMMKELLQAVKGKLVSAVLMVFLTIQLIVIGCSLMFSDDITRSPDLGMGVFMGLYGVLLATCILFLPSYVTTRFNSERTDNNVDLFFITTLKPRSIIWGKFLAGAVLAMLMFSACMPFLALTYLLRGIDIVTIFLLLGYGFLIVCGGIMLGIFVATIPGNALSRWFRYIVGFILLIGMVQISVIGSASAFRGGLKIGSTDFWLGVAIFGVIYFLSMGLLFFTSVAMVSPPAANRAIYVRPTMTAIWLITGAIALGCGIHYSDDDPVMAWAVSMVILTSVALLGATAERPIWGPRVLRAVPQNRILRTAAFFFYSGSPNGIAWAMVMFMLTVLIAAPFFKDRNWLIPLGMSLYFISYTMTAQFIRQAFLSRFNKNNLTVILTLAVMILATIVPVMIGFFTRENSRQELGPEWCILNPFVMFWEKNLWPMCLIISGIWAVISTVLNIPWFIKSLSAFKPFAPVKAGTNESTVQTISA